MEANGGHESSMRAGPFARHAATWRDVDPSAGRRPFMLGEAAVGWVSPEVAELLLDLGCALHGGAVRLSDPDALPALARRAADSGAFGWRGEAFDVRAAPDGPVLSTIDRGALPVFGIAAEGVHVNGLVEREDGLHLWVARRAAGKALDPGKLDHLVAGGIAAGMTAAETLIKEAGEEAGMAAELAGQARFVGKLSYVVLRPEGLRRDRLWCYDLVLPQDFQPAAQDGEVQDFELWPLARAYEAVRDTDDFKFNVNLVLIDLFRRLREP